MATLQELLIEAKNAYHDLQLGKAPASVRDSNGEEIRYTQANPANLIAYINSLQNEIAAASGQLTTTIGPMRFRF